MIEIIRADSRGKADHGWLKAQHTFSFAGYVNRERMGFGKLRVINEDHIAAGGGFDTHPHRDMEIVTYIIDGELTHRDSMGNGSVIRPGELQRMTAGTGVLHSEFNHSGQTTHLLQIWILPERKGLTPGYEQRAFPLADRTNQWRLVGDRDGRDGALTIHQDLSLYACTLDERHTVDYTLAKQREGFLQVVRGNAILNGESLGSGDGVMLTDDAVISLTTTDSCEVLLFDMAA